MIIKKKKDVLQIRNSHTKTSLPFTIPDISSFFGQGVWSVVGTLGIGLLAGLKVMIWLSNEKKM